MIADKQHDARNFAQQLDDESYTVSQMVLLALVYPIILGLDRIEAASFLRSYGTLQYLTGAFADVLI